jgi:hypothetical protein
LDVLHRQSSFDAEDGSAVTRKIRKNYVTLGDRPLDRVLKLAAVTKGRNNKLVGTWKLVAATSEDVASGQKTAMDGRTGYLNYSPDGRVFAILVDSDRKKPQGSFATATEAEGLFRSMVAYSGTYSVKGDRVVHQIDISWNETWTGTEQARDYKFDGEPLILVDGPSPNPRTGQNSVRTFVWEKIK